MHDLKNHTVAQLRKLAAQHNITGRSKMNKARLIQALQPHTTTQHDTSDLKTRATEEHLSSPSPKVIQPLAPPRPLKTPEPATLPTITKPQGARHPHEGQGPLIAPLHLGGMPIGYDREHLGLLIQSSDSVCCYWSFRSEEPEIFHAWEVELRLLDVTNGAPRLVRRERVDPRAGRWFVRNLTPDRLYIAQFGAVHDGQFTPRLFSKAYATPPNAPSTLREVTFVTVQFEEVTTSDSPRHQPWPHGPGLRMTHISGQIRPPEATGAMAKTWARQAALKQEPLPHSPTPSWYTAPPQTQDDPEDSTHISGGAHHSNATSSPTSWAWTS